MPCGFKKYLIGHGAKEVIPLREIIGVSYHELAAFLEVYQRSADCLQAGATRGEKPRFDINPAILSFCFAIRIVSSRSFSDSMFSLSLHQGGEWILRRVIR